MLASRNYNRLHSLCVVGLPQIESIESDEDEEIERDNVINDLVGAVVYLGDVAADLTQKNQALSDRLDSLEKFCRHPQS